jgi:hypothetical protein
MSAEITLTHLDLATIRVVKRFIVQAQGQCSNIFGKGKLVVLVR